MYSISVLYVQQDIKWWKAFPEQLLKTNISKFYQKSMHAFFLFLHEDTAALRLISDAKSFLGEQWCAWVFEQREPEWGFWVSQEINALKFSEVTVAGNWVKLFCQNSCFGVFEIKMTLRWTRNEVFSFYCELKQWSKL